MAEATSATLTLANVQMADGGHYRVEVSNAYGTATSEAATLTVEAVSGCTVPPAGLVGWWRGEDNAADALGSNPGTLDGGASYVAGEVGRAFQLDGTNGHVRIPAAASLDVGQGEGFTIETWINPADTAHGHSIVEWSPLTGGALGAALWISHPTRPDGLLLANIADTHGMWHLVETEGGAVQAGVWQHVALTYDKSSGAGKLYINGALVTEADLGTFTPQTSFDLVIGLRLPGSYPYAGAIDEVSLYNRALSGAQIEAIYAASSAGKCSEGEPPQLSPNPKARAWQWEAT